MKLRTILLSSLAILFLGLAWSASSITAQDTADPAAAEATADEPQRRLPAYFADLVTPGQREEIYEIQDKYEERIEALKKQLREVVAERDAEIEAVLQPEQRELLEVVKNQARLLREARAKAAARLKETLPEEPTSE